MENFTRIRNSILQNEDLTSSEKIVLAYLDTYQNQPDGTPTGNYCFETQEEISNNLKIEKRTIKNIIKSLVEKRLIFQSPEKYYNKTGKQFKSRKATIFVDNYNPFQLEKINSTKLKKDNPTKVKKDNPTQVEKAPDSTCETSPNQPLAPNQPFEVNQPLEPNQPFEVNQPLEPNQPLAPNQPFEVNQPLEPNQPLEDKYSGITYFNRFKIPNKFIQNGLWDDINFGNNGEKKRGLIKILNEQNTQKGFDYELERMNENYEYNQKNDLKAITA